MPSLKKFIVMYKDVAYGEDEDIKLSIKDLPMSQLYNAAWDYQSRGFRESKWRAVQVGIQLKVFAYGFFAMILAFGWLLYHKLWSKFFLSLFAFLVIGIIAHVSSLRMPIFYHWLFMLIYWGWCAYKANYWMVRKLYYRGYDVVGVVGAVTAEEAVAKYLEKRLNEPTVE